MKNSFSLLILIAFLPVLCQAAEIPLEILSVKAYAEYWTGQKIDSWQGQSVDDGGRKADRHDYYEVETMYKNNSPATLTDGDFSWKGSWKTHFWSHQGKRVEIIADLGEVYRLERVEVWQGGANENNTLIEKTTVWGALTLELADPWDSSQSREQKEHQKPVSENAYPLSFSMDASYRYLKIVCSSQLSASMVISEIKAFGSKAEAPIAEVPLPETAFRFELENMPGVFLTSRSGLSGEKGGCITGEHHLYLQLPAEAKLPLYSFLRYFDNGQRNLEWEINGQAKAMPVTGNQWRWVAGPVVDQHDLQITLRLIGKISGSCDSMIICSDPNFFSKQEPPLWQLKQIPELVRPPSFPEKLLQGQPEIDAAEFGRKVAQHYGYPETPPPESH